MWNALANLRLSAALCFASLVIAGCASQQPQSGGTDSAARDPANQPVAFYSVPLVCPAAPTIGCGSRAKPVLRHLEASPDIRQAWLNRAGTQMAIVWEEPGSARSRLRILNSLLKTGDLSAREQPRDEQMRAANEFNSQAGWYRAEGLDQLSEEEAGIIAARLMRRIQHKTELSEAKAETLRTAMTSTLKDRLVGLSEQPARSPEEERQAFLRKAAEYLSETEVAALRDAIASGFQPLPGEQ